MCVNILSNLTFKNCVFSLVFAYESITPIWQMRKLWHREVQLLVQVTWLVTGRASMRIWSSDSGTARGLSMKPLNWG